MVRSKRFRRCVVLALCVAPAGCSNNAPSPPAAAPATAAPSSSSAGQVVGKVAAPASGIPTVIVLEQKGAKEFLPQAQKPAMDQISLTFVPSMLFVRANQPADFLNNDDTLHNVHVTHLDTREPQFNVAIPTGEKYEYTFKREGFYHVGCDIHPAMSAEIFASASPYVTVADSDGSFAIDEVPPGAYVAMVYAGGKRTKKDVDVSAGTTQISIE